MSGTRRIGLGSLAHYVYRYVPKHERLERHAAKMRAENADIIRKRASALAWRARLIVTNASAGFATLPCEASKTHNETFQSVPFRSAPILSLEAV